MAGENLFALLDSLREELPFAVSDGDWESFKLRISSAAGCDYVYVPSGRRRKRSHLEVIAEAGEDADARQLAKMLGISVRRVQQLKKLCGK